MMSRLFAGACCVCLLSTLVLAQDNVAELKKLEGTWKLVGAEELGKQIPAENFEKFTLLWTVAGDKYVQKIQDKVTEEGTMVVRGDKAPKQFDTLATSGADKGKKQPAIYKIEGEILTIAASPAGSAEAPPSFTTTAESKFQVMMFKKLAK